MALSFVLSGTAANLPFLAHGLELVSGSSDLGAVEVYFPNQMLGNALLLLCGLVINQLS